MSSHDLPKASTSFDVSDSRTAVPLCAYDLTSSSSDEETLTKVQRKSPKKRKHLKRATGGGTVGLATDPNPILRSDWLQHLEETLEQTLARTIHSEPTTSGASEASDTDYEVDLNSLEISKNLKKSKKREQEIIPQAEAVTQPQVDTTESESFQVPKLRNRKFIFKPFTRNPVDASLTHDETKAPVEVIIPEQLAASFGLYIWPCSPVLAWYIWLHQEEIRDKEVLELGAGTALPGLLCAKIGAKKVYLSDQSEDPNTLKNIEEAVRLNSLQNQVNVVGLSWGDYTSDLFEFDSGCLDWIVGSDLFFDPDVFETLVQTISYLLNKNPRAQVLIAVQERSSDWSLEEWLLKYRLRCSYIYPRQFLKGTGIEESDLTGRHTIFILRLFRSSDDTN